jgi:hypothetical protein
MAMWKVAVAVTAIILVIGCGGSADKRRSTLAMDSLKLNDTDARMAFGRRAAPTVAEKEAVEDFVERQVSRLSGPAWQDGWEELMEMGKPAVTALIPLLDDQRPTYVQRNARPGAVNLKTTPELTLGELAYGLLIEMLYQHSDYSGELPPFNKASWESWWNTYGHTFRMSARMVSRGEQQN